MRFRTETSYGMVIFIPNDPVECREQLEATVEWMAEELLDAEWEEE